MTYVAALDADVLHPQITTDLLLRLAERRLFRIVWSRQILDEVFRSLVRRGIDSSRARRRLDAMESAFPEAMTEGTQDFLAIVPAEVDAGDRHVVATALAGKADAVVTRNLRHFPATALGRMGLEVQDLDSFLVNQWTLDQQSVEETLADMEADRTAPPRTIPELLAALEPLAPGFVRLVSQAAAS